jgi:hypothetical protein
MEVWRSGHESSPLSNSSVSLEGKGTFDRITINGNRSFPYLDINLSWDESNKLIFDVQRKPGKLVKYLNTDSHHHQHHKIVLKGVKLRLVLLLTMTASNVNLSMSNIYPDKHEALSIAGQIKPNGKMRTLRAILDEEESSGLTRATKKLRTIDKCDSLFIVKYVSLGLNKLIHFVVKQLRNEYKL